MNEKDMVVKIQIEDLPLVTKMFQLLRGAYTQSRLGKKMSRMWEKEVEELMRGYEARGHSRPEGKKHT